MARTKVRWVCHDCGFQSPRFLGRCTECSAWNSLIEQTVADEASLDSRKLLLSNQCQDTVLLSAIPKEQSWRFATGMASFDEVLGGGFVPGSVTLLAGDPGVGKSTLLMQACRNMADKLNVFYASAEESIEQIKLRATRLELSSSRVFVNSQQDVTILAGHLTSAKTNVAIIDSIQSLFHPAVTSGPGSVNQVRECAFTLIHQAKSMQMAVVLVGHVTKDGSIAGPRVLEHMVDVVLHFEGDNKGQLRILRALKNRFGSTNEVAIFTMGEGGLTSVEDPSALFLGTRLSLFGVKQAPSGTAVIVGGGRARALLLEVQALVGVSPYPTPRRVTNGWDLNRLLQILAVLEKKAGLSLSRFDVYVNMVGGFDFDDPGGDLGVSIALASSFLDRSIDPSVVFIGEVGLTGEVRPVGSIERRLKEAQRMGFKKALVPKANLPIAINGCLLEIISVEFLLEALKVVMPGQTFTLKGENSLSRTGDNVYGLTSSMNSPS